MKNMTELRTDLCDVYEKLRKGEIEPTKAKEISNVAGKIIKSAATQIEYKNMVQDKTPMPFMD